MKRLLFACSFLAASAATAAEPVSVALEARIFRVRSEDFKTLKLDAAFDIKQKTLTPAEHADLWTRLNACPGVENHARPMLIAASGQTVRHETGQQFPIMDGQTLSAATGVTNTITYKWIGTKLDLMPVVMKDSRIYIECSIEECNASPTLVTLASGVTVTAFDSHNLQASVLLDAGHSVLMSVGCHKVTNRFECKLDILGDLPLIGDWFRWRDESPDTEYTFLLVTPKVYEKAFAAPPPPPPAMAPARPPVVAAVTVQPAVLPVQAVATPACSPLATVIPALACGTTKCGDVHPATAGTIAEKASPHAIVMKVLLEQYVEACKAGDTVKAKALATHCLELDPLCFAKK